MSAVLNTDENLVDLAATTYAKLAAMFNLFRDHAKTVAGDTITLHGVRIPGLAFVDQPGAVFEVTFAGERLRIAFDLRLREDKGGHLTVFRLERFSEDIEAIVFETTFIPGDATSLGETPLHLADGKPACIGFENGAACVLTKVIAAALRKPRPWCDEQTT